MGQAFFFFFFLYYIYEFPTTGWSSNPLVLAGPADSPRQGWGEQVFRCVQQDRQCLGSTGLQVPSPAQHSELTIQRCCNYTSDLIPGQGTLYATGQPKKKEEEEEKKKKKRWENSLLCQGAMWLIYYYYYSWLLTRYYGKSCSRIFFFHFTLKITL